MISELSNNELLTTINLCKTHMDFLVNKGRLNPSGNINEDISFLSSLNIKLHNEINKRLKEIILK